MKRTIKEIETLLANDTISKEVYDTLANDARKGVQTLLKRYERQQATKQKLMEKWHKMMEFEHSIYEKGLHYIAGVDEVGRGPLAGPVVASAVILPKDCMILGLNDSKAMSKEKRERLYTEIMEQAVAIGMGVVSPAEIDELNIYQATKKAMTLALFDLQTKPEYVFIDAMELAIPIPQQSIIKGDAKSVSIAAASIIAKVTRDRYMEKLAKEYPMYHFEKNMGYPTKEHLEGIEKYGIIETVHRKSFNPIKEMLTQ